MERFDGLSLVNISANEIVKDFGRRIGRFKMPGEEHLLIEGATLGWVRGDYTVVKRLLVDAGAPDEFTTERSETKALVGGVVKRKATYKKMPKAQALQSIKDRAAFLISNKYPQWRQNNGAARAIRLIRKGESSWTVSEKAQMDAITATWDAIVSVRDRSNELEVAYEAGTKIDVKAGTIVGESPAKAWPVL